MSKDVGERWQFLLTSLADLLCLTDIIRDFIWARGQYNHDTNTAAVKKAHFYLCCEHKRSFEGAFQAGLLNGLVDRSRCEESRSIRFDCTTPPAVVDSLIDGLPERLDLLLRAIEVRESVQSSLFEFARECTSMGVRSLLDEFDQTVAMACRFPDPEEGEYFSARDEAYRLMELYWPELRDLLLVPGRRDVIYSEVDIFAHLSELVERLSDYLLHINDSNLDEAFRPALAEENWCGEAMGSEPRHVVPIVARIERYFARVHDALSEPVASRPELTFCDLVREDIQIIRKRVDPGVGGLAHTTPNVLQMSRGSDSRQTHADSEADPPVLPSRLSSADKEDTHATGNRGEPPLSDTPPARKSRQQAKDDFAAYLAGKSRKPHSVRGEILMFLRSHEDYRDLLQDEKNKILRTLRDRDTFEACWDRACDMRKNT